MVVTVIFGEKGWGKKLILFCLHHSIHVHGVHIHIYVSVDCPIRS